MQGVAYTSSVLLASVFAWAGAAKLVDPAATRRAFTGLGLPPSFAVAVPVVELVLAVGLVLVPGWAAVAAVALLAAFTTVLVSALRAGSDVGCGCFGTSRREPVSFVEVVRNVLLGLSAAVAIAANGPVMPELEDVLLVSVLAAGGCLVIALCDLRRRTGSIVGVEVPGT